MSFIGDAFSAPKQKVEPIPTRDTAADALDAEREAKRRALLGMGGLGSTMLSGPGGVTRELTGTRSLNQ
ncbi:hypothetical protein [Dongia sp. agr-C8]